MILWRVIRREFADAPLSVEGAKSWPGRWHSAGTAVLYTASTESLALLERFVHLALELRSIPHIRLKLEVPPGAIVEAMETLTADPPDWRSDDPSSARAFGDEWARNAKSLGLSVPSVLCSSERNVLLSATSPQFADVKVLSADEFLYDERMWKAENKATKRTK